MIFPKHQLSVAARKIKKRETEREKKERGEREKERKRKKEKGREIGRKRERKKREREREATRCFFGSVFICISTRNIRGKNTNVVVKASCSGRSLAWSKESFFSFFE